MSELAVIYKQANDQVLKRYQDNPEDQWRVSAIQEHRDGTRNHDSVMTQFVNDVETVVTDLFNSAASIPVSVAPAVAPTSKSVSLN